MKKFMIVTAAAMILASSAAQAAPKTIGQFPKNSSSNGLQNNASNKKPAAAVVQFPTIKPATVYPNTNYHPNHGQTIIVINPKPYHNNHHSFLPPYDWYRHGYNYFGYPYSTWDRYYPKWFGSFGW